MGMKSKGGIKRSLGGALFREVRGNEYVRRMGIDEVREREERGKTAMRIRTERNRRDKGWKGLSMHAEIEGGVGMWQWWKWKENKELERRAEEWERQEMDKEGREWTEKTLRKKERELRADEEEETEEEEREWEGRTNMYKRDQMEQRGTTAERSTCKYPAGYEKKECGVIGCRRKEGGKVCGTCRVQICETHCREQRGGMGKEEGSYQCVGCHEDRIKDLMEVQRRRYEEEENMGRNKREMGGEVPSRKM